MGLLSKLNSKIQATKVGIERTYLYKASPFHFEGDAVALDLGALDLQVLDEEQLVHLGEIGPFSTDEGIERLQRGDRCYAAWDRDHLVHYSWVQSAGEHPIDAAGLSRPVCEGDFWIYNCRTAEPFRGRGIYPAILCRIIGDYFDAGHSRAWIYTSETNRASQSGIRKAGFVPAGTLRALRIGPYCRQLSAA